MIRRSQSESLLARHKPARSDWLRSAWQSEVSRPYENFMPARSKPYRNLTSVGGTTPAFKEGVMLDLVFVALGFALIGLMGLYAAGLRRL